MTAWKRQETPRYNVVTFRVSDEELERLHKVLCGESVSTFCRGAVMESVSGWEERPL